MYTISTTASGDSTGAEMNNKDAILHYLGLQEISHLRVWVIFKYGVGEGFYRYVFDTSFNQQVQNLE